MALAFYRFLFDSQRPMLSGSLPFFSMAAVFWEPGGVISSMLMMPPPVFGALW